LAWFIYGALFETADFADRHIYGWYIWLWALRKARTKRRGAGPQRWEHALKTAACARWLVTGQQPERAPMFMRDLVFGALMTVRELIDELSKFPRDMPVVTWGFDESPNAETPQPRYGKAAKQGSSYRLVEDYELDRFPSVETVVVVDWR
jgi:hypothetical protein